MRKASGERRLERMHPEPGGSGCGALLVAALLFGAPLSESEAAQRTAQLELAAAPPAAAVGAAGASATAPARPVAGPADSWKNLTPGQRASYRRALEDGRQFCARHEYPAAIEAFQRALSISPGDPRALIELGWAAFLKGDLELAEASTRKAERSARRVHLQGQLYYNLGRIEEKKGRLELALSYYETSLRERPDDVVRRRLARLAFQATPMAGPFEPLERWCQQPELVKEDLQGGGRLVCPQGALEVLPGFRPRSALQEAGLVRTKADDGSWNAPTSTHLAIRTPRGWFVGPTIFTWQAASAPARNYNTRFQILGPVEIHEPSAGHHPLELLLRYRVTREEGPTMDEDIHVETRDDFMILCGIDPSGVPSCTRAIGLAHSERVVPVEDDLSAESDASGGDEKSSAHLKPRRSFVQWRLKATVLPDGTVKIERAGLRGLRRYPPEARWRLGSHSPGGSARGE